MIPSREAIDTGRVLESEALDGGRISAEFSMCPADDIEPEDVVLDRPFDDVDEVEERLSIATPYVEYAKTAFRQRRLEYPFEISSSGMSLDVLQGHDELARRWVSLGKMANLGNPDARRFEKRAFVALQRLTGGWGISVGSPREGGDGPGPAVSRFRSLLHDWERGGYHQGSYPSSGDLGADGFLLLGRPWGGPLVFFQAKNTGFSLRDYPSEAGRLGNIINEWFGKRVNEHKSIVPVLGVNDILTLDSKGDIFRDQAPHGVHILDSVDILLAESEPAPCHDEHGCVHL